MTDLYDMTISQIKIYAEEKNIDLSGIRTKAEMIGKILDLNASLSNNEEKNKNIIESTSIRVEQRTPKSSTITNDTNVVASRHAENTFQKIVKKENKIEGKVALFSNKNIHWVGLGHISKGYNIVTKEEAEKWLTRSGIREARPDEVATYYGL